MLIILKKAKEIISRLPDRFAVESHKERTYPRDPHVPSEFGHIQKRRQLFGGIPEEGAESRELRLRTVNVNENAKNAVSILCT